MARNRLLHHITVALVASTLLGGAAVAQNQPSKGEQALKYRKSLYQVIAWNFAPMGAMAQGKAPFNATQFAMRADAVAHLAPMLSEAYPPESRDVAGSKLKPEMWSNRSDFDAKLQDLVDKTATLAKVAQTGDEATAKQAFFDAANACKACHDKYKAD